MFQLRVIIVIEVIQTDHLVTPRQQTSLEKVEAKRARLTQLWTEGDGHTGDHSAWEAFNAVAQSVDHDDEIWKVRTQRTQQLTDGSLYSTKNAVFATLLKAAK